MERIVLKSERKAEDLARKESVSTVLRQVCNQTYSLIQPYLQVRTQHQTLS